MDDGGSETGDGESKIGDEGRKTERNINFSG